MVVYVVHTRDRRAWRSGDASAMMGSRNLVRLNSRSVAAAAPAIPSSSSSGGALSRSRYGGRPLRATSPPPPASIRSRPLGATSPPPPGSRSLRATSPPPSASIRSRPLRATSPPPPASIGSRPLRATSPPPARIPSVACLDSRTLRSDDEDWEEVVVAAGGADAPDALQEATDGVVFGVPPTEDEVRAAVASIKRVFEKAAAVDSEAADLQALALPISVHPSSGLFVNHFALGSDASKVGLDEWTEPATLVLNSSALLPKGHQSVLDAFHLLQDASVQKMVMGITTDKTVWDVVMNNDAVQEFKRSFQEAKETDLKGSSTTPPGFMMWVLENTKAKIKEFLEKILGLVNMLFQVRGEDYDFSDDIVRMSFMLSVFVFIVVTIARIR